IQRAGAGAADGHLTADVLHLQIVVAPALYIDAALDVRGANQVATPDVQAHVAADARNPHTAAAVDLQIAIHIGHLVIAVAAAALNREALGENDLQVVGDPLVAVGPILIGAHHQPVALRDDLDRCLAIAAVRVGSIDGLD